MDKAGKALRRSGVKLKSISSGHSQLQLVISQIREVKCTFKAFIAAQATLSQDLLNWSSQNENQAIQATFTSLSELSLIWTDVQNEFLDYLKKFRKEFERFYEFEKHIDQSQEMYLQKEHKESKLQKDLKKSSKKEEDIKQLEEKISQAKKSKEVARFEINEQLKENEAIKIIRVKEGLSYLGKAYIDMSNKCGLIHNVHCKISSFIPDVHDKAIHEIKYNGSESTTLMQELKDKLQAYDLNRSMRAEITSPHSSTPVRPSTFPDSSFSDASFNRSDSFSYPTAPTASAIATPNINPIGIYPHLPVSPNGTTGFTPNAPPPSNSPSIENLIVEKFQKTSISPSSNGRSFNTNSKLSPAKTPPYNPYYCLRSSGCLTNSK